METTISKDYLPVYKALASPVRLRLIQLLSKEELSVADLAERMGLSATITARHLAKLEQAHIIHFQHRGHKKIARLKVDQINVHFPETIYELFNVYQTEVPVGQFTNFSVEPSCGMASRVGYIGKVDNPSYFMDPRRMDAGMVWWNNGYLEYQLPNHLEEGDQLQMIDIVAELGSEFPSLTITGPPTLRSRSTAPSWAFGPVPGTFRTSGGSTRLPGYRTTSTSTACRRPSGSPTTAPTWTVSPGRRCR